MNIGTTSAHTMAHGHNNICNTLEMLYAFANDSLHILTHWTQSVVHVFDCDGEPGEDESEKWPHSNEESATVAHHQHQFSWLCDCVIECWCAVVNNSILSFSTPN